MDITRKARIGGIAITAALLIGLATIGYEVDRVRLGGPLQVRNQMVSDLSADILPPPAYVIEPYLEATLLVANPASLATRQAALTRLKADYAERMRYWTTSTLDDDLKTQLTTAVQDSGTAFWTEMDKDLLPAVASGDPAAIQTSYARLSGLYAAHRASVDALVKTATLRQAELATTSATSLRNTVIGLVVMGLMLMGLLIAAIWALMRGALRPMQATATAMRRMADGDLDVTLVGATRDDEIGAMVQAVDVFRAAARAQRANGETQRIVVQELGRGLSALSQGDLTHRIGGTLPEDYRALGTSFDTTMDSLAATMASVARSAALVERGSEEIRQASDDLSQRTEQQAASLEQTAAAMQQVTTTVRDAAGNTAQASAAVEDARTDSVASGAIMRRAIAAIDGVAQTSIEISDIVSVIDGIAFQTNLLALNAGVEAARAGQAGLGFAVVASEVRALAQRSADAARDVKGRINASTAQVGDGATMVRDAGQMLDKVIDRIGGISTLMTALAASARSQASGLVEVNTTVTEMDAVTQQNAAMVEEATASARSLASEAHALAGEVARFRLDAPTGRRMPDNAAQRLRAA